MIFLFLLLSLFSYAPHHIVIENNNNLSHILLNGTCLKINEISYEDPIKCAEVELLGAYPSVDNRISTFKTFILWRYAYLAENIYKEVIDENFCKDNYSKEFEKIELLVNLSVVFSSFNYTIILNTSNLINPIELPLDVETLNKSDFDQLNISLYGEIIFFYKEKIENYEKSCSNEGCFCAKKDSLVIPIIIKRNFSSFKRYFVESRDPLHFLEKPILREQLLENQLFSDYIFSNRRAAKIKFFVDGEEKGNRTFYKFKIVNDTFGYMSIESVLSDENYLINSSEHLIQIKPVQLIKENITYNFLYTLNTTLSLKPNISNVTVIFYDHFNQTFFKSFFIAQRAQFINSTLSRPFKEFLPPNLKLVQLFLPFAIIFLFLIIFFSYRNLKSARGEI